MCLNNSFQCLNTENYCSRKKTSKLFGKVFFLSGIWVILSKICYSNTNFRKLLILVFKIQTMLFGGTIVNTLKYMGPTLTGLHLNDSISPTLSVPSVFTISLPSPSFTPKLSILSLLHNSNPTPTFHHHRLANPIINPTCPNPSLLLPNAHPKALINPSFKLTKP